MFMKKHETPREFKRRKAKAMKVARALAKLYPRAKVFLSHSNPWELLVAVILSAQCTDKQVNKVTAVLFRKYKRFSDYLKVAQSKFEQDIHSTGFYKNKAKNVLGAAKVVHERFRNNVPKTMEELLTLPGVGRKTANIVLSNAYGIVVGIPVDTHVLRLSRLLGLSDEHDPNRVEQDLMRLLPKNEWFGISYRLIQYGRDYCSARKHDHATCPLSKI